jgi:hypothetical protein
MTKHVDRSAAQRRDVDRFAWLDQASEVLAEVEQAITNQKAFLERLAQEYSA